MTTWNSADAAANIALSGGSLIATTTSSTQGAVRATASVSTKTYIEAFILNGTGTLWSIGFADATFSVTAAAGSTTDSVVTQPNQARNFFNNGGLGTLQYAPGALNTICIAFDPVGKLWWARINGGIWNNSGTANPATGTGGLSVAAIAAGPYFPYFSSNGSGAQVQANFGATSFSYAPPSGFAGMDANAQAYEASSKFLGYSVLGVPTNAELSSKFLSYSVISQPRNMAASPKFIAYAVVVPLLPLGQIWT